MPTLPIDRRAVGANQHVPNRNDPLQIGLVIPGQLIFGPLILERIIMSAVIDPGDALNLGHGIAGDNMSFIVISTDDNTHGGYYNVGPLMLFNGLYALNQPAATPCWVVFR